MVGANSRGNGFVLVFGKSVEPGSRDLVGLPPLIPDWNTTEMCEKYLDGYSYHLKEYSSLGYKTMLAFDYTQGLAYYPNCSGFREREADHIWKPFEIRLLESSRFNKYKRSCGERHLEMLDYMEKFMKAYPVYMLVSQPSFASDFFRIFRFNKTTKNNIFLSGCSPEMVFVVSNGYIF
ncbi:hypothetical protein TELCIR_02050 [Teladorsagia circumcincta]|uniref:Uncharacterized protein n=1 Tax=Teladorsagia circumcincta TaxID=45464 RepID=A0A2G9V2C5_TELCI|nr:hypothetical protein TELCIR_02050 [Teladorsagia circumcincta]